MKLSLLSAPEAREAAAQGAIALIPLGATEQHGPHLAVATDTVLASALAEEAERRLPAAVVLFPALPYGSSHHHLAFGGTVSLPAELYTAVVAELVRTTAASGFRRIVLCNGHGGNITPVRQALAILGRDPGAPEVALATYWELAGPAFAGEPPMESPALSHACEYETSLMLHIAPEGVHLERARRAGRPPANGYVAWEDDEPYRGVTVFRRTEAVSSNGSSGEPQRATAAKGAHLFERAAAALTAFLAAYREWEPAADLRPAEGESGHA